MKSTFCKLLTVVGLTATLGVQAAPLAPGAVIPPIFEPDPVGGVMIANLVQPFAAPTFSGSLISQVWAGDASNPYGGLTFTYQISNNSFSLDPIDRFTVSSYGTFLTDASVQIGAAPVLPQILPTTIVRSFAGNQISFNFDSNFQGTLIQGSSSAVLVIQTSSSSFQNAIGGVINSSSANVPTFAPLGVPEPASAALVLLGAAVLGFRRKK